MLLSSPHVHTQYCDGKSTAEEMVQSALERGFSSIGFSSHAKQHFDPHYSMSEQGERDYIAEVRFLREKYKGRIRIWLGMERDLFSYAEREPYDYIIASVHYLQSGDEYIAVDGYPEKVDGLVNECFHGDGLLFAKAYFDQLSGYVSSCKPDIIGHFDLVRKNNLNNRYFDTLNAAYRDIAYGALEKAASSGALLELNTGGMARSSQALPYPEPFLLRAWREMNGGVILSSDCHKAGQIDAYYEACLPILRKAGYDMLYALGRNDTLFETYAI